MDDMQMLSLFFALLFFIPKIILKKYHGQKNLS